MHYLRKLITHALPDLEQAAKQPLLLHQFLAGIPESIAKQLRASDEVTMLDATITHARLLMTIELELVAILTEKPDKMRRFREQVAILAEQVALLATNQSRDAQPPRSHSCCFHCNQMDIYNITAVIVNVSIVAD